MNHLIKSCIKSLPVASTLLKHRYNKRFLYNKNEQLYKGRFNTWLEANNSAPVEHTGYDTDSTTEMYQSLMDKIDIHDYPAMFWLMKLPGHVFDYGGHVGIKYYAYSTKANFGYWEVCDVPAVVARGKELAEELKVEQYLLSFTTEFNNVNEYFKLFCSGSLQYIQESLASKLSNVKSLPKHVVINTTAFTLDDEPEWFTLNSIGTAYCPYKIQNENQFNLDMKNLGYKMVASWENPNRASEVPYLGQSGKFKYCGGVWSL